jgi:hypothetical protein
VTQSDGGFGRETRLPVSGSFTYRRRFHTFRLVGGRAGLRAHARPRVTLSPGLVDGLAHPVLGPFEPELRIGLEATDRMGHIRADVELTPEHLTQTHRMHFEIDPRNHRICNSRSPVSGDLYGRRWRR